MSTDRTQPAATYMSADDLALVHANRSGDVAAFEELVKRYDHRLLRIAQHVTHNREDAEDMVQEALLKAFQNLSQFQENAKFSTWLIRIVLNEAFMKLRKQRRGKELSLDDDLHGEDNGLPHDLADWSANPEQLYSASELREILIRSLQELRPGLRVVFSIARRGRILD